MSDHYGGCENLIPGYCTKTRQPCPHCIVDGKCDVAKCSNAVIPTWQEIIDIYISAMKPNRRREDNIKMCVARFVSAIGAELSDKVGVTDEQMDEAYAKLLDRYSPYTVQSTFFNVGACFSRKRDIQKEYKRVDKTQPNIVFPSVSKPCLEPTILTPEQRVHLNQIMSILRASKNPYDHRKYVWLWFAWRVGMRPSDIRRVTWKCLTIHSDGSHWLDYVPHKTSVSTGGRKAGGQISIEQYLEISPFIGKPDEPVIRKFKERIPDGGCIHVSSGECSDMCMSVVNWVIDMMRNEIGVVDPKPAYVLRKDCAAIITAEYGPIRAAQMLGDNVNMLLKYYVNIHNIKLKDGL